MYQNYIPDDVLENLPKGAPLSSNRHTMEPFSPADEALVQAAMANAMNPQPNPPLSNTDTTEARGPQFSRDRSDIQGGGLIEDSHTPTSRFSNDAPPFWQGRVSAGNPTAAPITANRGGTTGDGTFTSGDSDTPVSGISPVEADAWRRSVDAAANGTAYTYNPLTSQYAPPIVVPSAPAIGPAAPNGIAPAFIAAQAALQNQTHGPVSSPEIAARIAANLAPKQSQQPTPQAPWTVQEQRGISGEPGYTESARTFTGGGNFTDTDNTPGKFNPAAMLTGLKGKIPDDDLSRLNTFAQQPNVTPQQLNTAIDSTINRDNKPGPGQITPLQKWKANVAALRDRRSTASQKLHGLFAEKAKNEDSLLYDPNSPVSTKLNSDIESAQKAFDDADGKYSNALDSVPTGEQQQPDSSSPATTQPSTGDGGFGNPVSMATPFRGPTALLQAFATPLSKGMSFKQGQFIRAGNNVHQVIGFDGNGEPLFSQNLAQA